MRFEILATKPRRSWSSRTSDSRTKVTTSSMPAGTIGAGPLQTALSMTRLRVKVERLTNHCVRAVTVLIPPRWCGVATPLARRVSGTGQVGGLGCPSRCLPNDASDRPPP
jgi:hypothetical protein